MNEEGWTGEQFDEVDWTRLHGALGNTLEGYKTWLAKQHTGFCGTRVQVGYYNGNPNGDLSCPNCREREDASHLCLWPNEDRVRLFTEGINDLEGWMKKRDKTDPEISYWLPMYIKCRGTRRFQNLGRLSPNMTALAKSQDKIGWRNLMEGCFSKHFYEMQSIHLAFGSTYLNGEDWVKKKISQVLQITHSQWICRNCSLHDKRSGYLRRQNMK